MTKGSLAVCLVGSLRYSCPGDCVRCRHRVHPSGLSKYSMIQPLPIPLYTASHPLCQVPRTLQASPRGLFQPGSGSDLPGLRPSWQLLLWRGIPRGPRLTGSGRGFRSFPTAFRAHFVKTLGSRKVSVVSPAVGSCPRKESLQSVPGGAQEEATAMGQSRTGRSDREGDVS